MSGDFEDQEFDFSNAPTLLEQITALTDKNAELELVNEGLKARLRTLGERRGEQALGRFRARWERDDFKRLLKKLVKSYNDGDARAIKRVIQSAEDALKKHEEWNKRGKDFLYGG